MAKSKKNSLKSEVKKEKELSKTKFQELDTSEDFDFGGIPKEINLKKNIGCGG